MRVPLPTRYAFGILAVAWLGLCFYAYPGFMSYDSVQQLREARAGFYTD